MNSGALSGSAVRRGKPALVIFEGGRARTMPERMMQRAREAIVLEHIEKAHASGAFSTVIVCTNRADLAKEARRLGAEIDMDAPGVPFHYGQRLQHVIRERGLGGVVSMGGGAAPLISVDEMRAIGQLFDEHDRFVAANNVHSADIVAFAPADAVLPLPPPPMDNSLALILHHQTKLPLLTLPRTLGLHFDVDTPSDLLVLAVHPDRGKRVAASLEQFPVDLSPFEAAKATLLDSGSDVFIYGRVGGLLFSYLDERTRCRIRLLSEERGMKALGRDERGEVRSVLGFVMEHVGVRGVMRMWEETCSTVFVDTRVLMAHMQGRAMETGQGSGVGSSSPSDVGGIRAADRFYSDLKMPGRIQNRWLRDLTAATLETSLPVLLGGHGLVHGGIWALVDAAYREGYDLAWPEGADRGTVRSPGAPGTPVRPGPVGLGSIEGEATPGEPS